MWIVDVDESHIIPLSLSFIIKIKKLLLLHANRVTPLDKGSCVDSIRGYVNDIDSMLSSIYRRDRNNTPP